MRLITPSLILACLFITFQANAADLRGQLAGLPGASIDVQCGNIKRHAVITNTNRFYVTDLPANQSCYFVISQNKAESVRISFHTRQNITEFNGSLRKIGNRIIVVRK